MTERIPLPEAPGVAYADVYTPGGLKVCVTARDITADAAVKSLIEAITSNKLLGFRPDQTQTKSESQPLPPPVIPPPPDDPAWTEPDQPLPQTPPESKVPVLGRDWGIVDRKPKASDLDFGDRYEIKVDEYEATAREIKFYATGMKYPSVSHNLANEFALNKFLDIFNNWHPEEDDVRRPIPGGAVILAVQCTDKTKKTSSGNPYQNLDGMRRP